MQTWEEAKAAAGCTCEHEEAWRCAQAQQLAGVIGCPCFCHRRIAHQVKAAPPADVGEQWR